VIQAVRPERLLRELDELWVSLGEQDGVLRACTMTLIVVEEESAAGSGEIVARLMRQHPSRAITIRVRSGAGDQLEARVLAECWMPFGNRQQICCERIDVVASRCRLTDVAALLPALVAPDLPVVLWCRSPELISAPGWPALAAGAGKLIVDSAAFPASCQAFECLRKCAAGRAAVADLAWTRLTPWRESIARIFDPPEGTERLKAVSEFMVCCLDSAPSVAGYYLAGWLNTAFAGPAAPRVRIETASEECVRVLGADLSIPRPAAREECELLREELKILGRDPVYERSLDAACRLAKSPGGEP
jgi:glucose-6-phosphate dehydrogenase assembly protein OpcA